MLDQFSGLNFKKSNIRIWIHQRNLGNLQQVVWEGNGGKLLPEHSNNTKIKKFLDAVPHIMVSIDSSILVIQVNEEVGTTIIILNYFHTFPFNKEPNKIIRTLNKSSMFFER